MSIVYKATNSVNGKAYIGVTRQRLASRKAQHKCRALSGTGGTFYAAIRKYGWDAFTWEILEEGVPLNKIDEREVALIAEHKTMVSTRRGYNRTIGGAGTAGIEFTETQRENHRKAMRASAARKYGLKRQARLFHNRTGIPHTDDTKSAISASLRKLPLGTVPAKLHFSMWPEIRGLRENGLSFKKIGEMFGVRPETVFYFCRRREARPA